MEISRCDKNYWNAMTRTFTIIIVIALISILAATGCVSRPIVDNKTIEKTIQPTPNTVTSIPTVSPGQLIIKNNQTLAQEKIQTSLLNTIDPNSPKMYRQDYPESIFIPAEEATGKFNISNTKAVADGGEYFIHIDLQPTASVDIIDPFATKITSKDAKEYYVDAWVGKNNIILIASLPEVKKIHIIQPGYTS